MQNWRIWDGDRHHVFADVEAETPAGALEAVARLFGYANAADVLRRVCGHEAPEVALAIYNAPDIVQMTMPKLCVERFDLVLHRAQLARFYRPPKSLTPAQLADIAERAARRDELRARRRRAITLLAILPARDVDRLERLERLARVLRAKRAGASSADIATRLGVSPNRVRELVDQARRRERFKPPAFFTPPTLAELRRARWPRQTRTVLELLQRLGSAQPAPEPPP